MRDTRNATPHVLVAGTKGSLGLGTAPPAGASWPQGLESRPRVSNAGGTVLGRAFHVTVSLDRHRVPRYSRGRDGEASRLPNAAPGAQNTAGTAGVAEAGRWRGR